MFNAQRFRFGFLDTLEGHIVSIEDSMFSETDNRNSQGTAVRLSKGSGKQKSLMATLSNIYPSPIDPRASEQLRKSRSSKEAPDETPSRNKTISHFKRVHSRRPSFEDALKQDILELMDKSLGDNNLEQFQFSLS